MRVWIDKDEWYPIYFPRTDIPDFVLERYPEEVVEMGDKDYERLKKSYDIACKNFGAVQDELEGLITKNMKKIKSAKGGR